MCRKFESVEKIWIYHESWKKGGPPLCSLFLSRISLSLLFSFDLFVSPSITAACRVCRGSARSLAEYLRFDIPRWSKTFTDVLLVLHSPASVLRALWVRGEGHSRYLSPALHDGVPHDHTRNFTAYGEDTFNK